MDRVTALAAIMTDSDCSYSPEDVQKIAALVIEVSESVAAGDQRIGIAPDSAAYKAAIRYRIDRDEVGVELGRDEIAALVAFCKALLELTDILAG